MATKELSQAYDSLTDDVKSAILALSILINRIGSFSKADRDDLFELLQEWRKAKDPEEQHSIRQAMEEILAQTPVAVRDKALTEEKPWGRGRKKWAEHVGSKVKELREQANLTQTALAQKAGLPQSQISRVENAEHSATSLTLEKIAKALGVQVRQIDPCAE